MDLYIHPEKTTDFVDIYRFVKLAFKKANDPDGDEHDYVNGLRKSKHYIPELALTMKDGAKIIGHIMLTRTFIKRNTEKVEALLLSPICIHQDYRNKGLGSQLIQYSLQLAEEKGFKAVFLVGDPQFYSRLGFKSVTNWGIKHKGNIAEKFTLGIELEKGYLENKGGTISIY